MEDSIKQVTDIIKESLELYNSEKYRYIPYLVDLRNKEYAIIACKTNRPHQRKQYIVVRRDRTSLNPEDFYQVVEIVGKFGTTLGTIRELDIEKIYQRPSDYVILGPSFEYYAFDRRSSLSPHHLGLERLLEISSIINVDEILDKMIKADLLFGFDYLYHISNSNASSLKGIFGNDIFNAIQRTSDILKMHYLNMYEFNSMSRTFFEFFNAYTSFEVFTAIKDFYASSAGPDHVDVLCRTFSFAHYSALTPLSSKQILTIIEAFKGKRINQAALYHLRDYWNLRTRIKDVYDIKKLPILPNNLGCADIHMNLEAIVKKHDFVLNIFNTHLDAIKSAKLNKLQENYANLHLAKAQEFEWEDDNYIIVAPKHLSELITEGKSLSHCVGSYTDSVSQGKEYILFLRKKSNPGASYFTIDVTPDKKVRQIHGQNNCSVPGDLAPIVQKWADAVNTDISDTSGVYSALH